MTITLRHAPALLAVLAACGASEKLDTVRAPHLAPIPIAGSRVAAAPDLPLSPAEIAAARAKGPAGLAPLLAAYDAMAPGAARDAYGLAVDRVAGQRYATVSRLYWYTDLDAAKAEAVRLGRPILSLRLLGRLDEDLSCANSRLFRVVLYGNATVSKYLADHFVLYWSSERPVPRVTIDYGDGRVLERTVTGNSAHYVLDETGAPIDILPGMWSPAAFVHELDGSLATFAAVRGKTGKDRRLALADAHGSQLAALGREWGKLTGLAIPALRYGDALVSAERMTMSKAAMEMPIVETVKPGTRARALPDDSGAWEQIGIRWLAMIAPAAPAAAGQAVANPPVVLPAAGGALPPPVVLDARARELAIALRPSDWAAAPRPLTGAALDAVLGQLDSLVVADTGHDYFRLRNEVHQLFVSQDPMVDDFAALDRWMYEIFKTPASDPWLGLSLTGVWSGLPDDGIVRAR